MRKVPRQASHDDAFDLKVTGAAGSPAGSISGGGHQPPNTTNDGSGSDRGSVGSGGLHQQGGARLNRRLNLLNGIALVVGTMIGEMPTSIRIRSEKRVRLKKWLVHIFEQGPVSSCPPRGCWSGPAPSAGP